MRFLLLVHICIIFLMVSCDKEDLVWELPRKNDLDSLQNLHPVDSRAPVANFTTSSRLVRSGENTRFINSSSQNPTSFAWQFPGGNPSSSTDENPSVSYLGIGRYDVTLSVSNAYGYDSKISKGFVESYYHKSFSNNSWDGWLSNGWAFSSSGACPDCISAWQNSSNSVIPFTLTRSFSNVSNNARLEFYYFIYSPGGTVRAKINNITVFNSMGFGSGIASVPLGNNANFTVTIEALVGYTQSIFVNDIKILP